MLQCVNDIYKKTLPEIISEDERRVITFIDFKNIHNRMHPEFKSTATKDGKGGLSEKEFKDEILGKYLSYN